MTSFFRQVRQPMQRRKKQAGQALIELYFIILFMFFLAIGAYEVTILYHNFNVVENALKQAVWKGALGADDITIAQTIANADEAMGHSAYFWHRVSNFGVSVWVPTPDGREIFIAPQEASRDGAFTGGTGSRAAYIYRAFNMNLRVGVTYHVAFSTLWFGTANVFAFSVPLTKSQPILARNDEDRDGLVDIYEPELFTQLLGEDTWVPYDHLDNGVSDALSTDDDGDGISDYLEEGNANYDFNNNGILDPEDPGVGNNMLRHPIIGGNAASI